MGSKKQTTSTPFLFEDKPLFGLDIGLGTVRVMQVSSTKTRPKVIGYGEASFDPSYITNGIISRPLELAGVIQKLFKHSLVGGITTRRIALSLPISKAFTRSVEMPKLTEKELETAVATEVEQYIPANAESLYVDHTSAQTDKDTWTVFIVAMPRRIVDSYLSLGRLLGLEVVAIQTSSGAGAYLFGRDPQSSLPCVLVDFGSQSADITVYDQNPIVSGTVACGGEEITKLIRESLQVSEREAIIIKSKYGLSYSKKQKQIEKSLSGPLDVLTKEIQRSVRYFDERSKSKRNIAQIVIMGGGANMPGIADYLTNQLRIPVRAFDPTAYIDFGHLQPISVGERMSYVTATGLSIINPRKVF